MSSSNMNFCLDADFVSKYENVEPPFGFNGLGELVYLRTYSRMKENGEKERWYETVARVVNGTYTIQKRHIKSSKLPWNEKKAQKSAQEMYDRMFNMKFLPPGRGLWAMGTSAVEERGLGLALNNCFGYETEIITKGGIKKIGELSGTDVEVLTSGGEWVLAPIRSFGVQKLMKMVISRSGVEKVIFATKDHRWFVKSTKGRYKDAPYLETTTENLEHGHRLLYEFGAGSLRNNVRMSPFGIAHGIAFGDGTLGWKEKSYGSYIYLCGKKNEELYKYFNGCPSTFDPNKGTEGALRVSDLPRFFKLKPDFSESKSYLLGWLAGYFAADGSINKDGNEISICSSKKENVELVRDVCSIIGIGTHSIISTQQTLNGEKFPSYRINLMGCHLPDDFFLLEEHITRFKKNKNKESVTRYWTVRSIEETDREEEVFCATVEGKGNFVLEGNILTGNCAFVSTESMDEEPYKPFVFMMDALMLGVGVGFDTKGKGKVRLFRTRKEENGVIGTRLFTIEDTREGWVNSIKELLSSYFENKVFVEFNYDEIRPLGTPIKGFGGLAAGPGPLMDCHERIRKILDDFIGEERSKEITDRVIVDIMNVIGKCVVSGNVRRSAQIAFGDPNSEEYVNLKNYEINPEREEFGWASNNSVFAELGQDYKKIADSIRRNGEPGLLWLENARNYSRMVETEKDGKDWRVVGCNPCFSGNMRLYTDKGYKNVLDLWEEGGYQEFGNLNEIGTLAVVNNTGVYDATCIYKTNELTDIFEVEFKSGAVLEVTENHEFPLLLDGNVEKVKTVSLSPGDKIYKSYTQCFGMNDYLEYAELAGWIIGDGSLSPKKDGQVSAIVSCYENDIEEAAPFLKNDLLAVYERSNTSTNQSPDYSPWERNQKFFNHRQINMSSCLLGRLLKEDGVVPGDKHKIPSSIWESNRQTVSAFLRGLFSADGSVQISGKGRISVRLSQANKKLLLDCQILLTQLGIYSSVLKRRDSRDLLMNDGVGGKKIYTSSDMYELIISGRDNLCQFFDEIGFLQKSKNNKLNNWLTEHKGSNNSRRKDFDVVKSVRYLCQGPSFCITEPKTNRIKLNGIDTFQCVEQSLESFECCCLVETFPAKHDNFTDFSRTLKFAYLYAKSVTLVKTHWEETNEVMMRNRRIGCSISGVAQFLAKHGVDELRKWCTSGYEVVKLWDNKYSEWFTTPKSIKTTSIKPSGTVSLLNGSTPGMHFPESRFYIRRMRIAKNSELVPQLKKSGYHMEPAFGDEEHTLVVEIPVDAGEGVRVLSDVSMWEQLSLAALLQEVWSDNQVSATITFDPEMEGGQIESAINFFQYKLKGISFLPRVKFGAYKQMPYEEISRVKYNLMLDEISDRKHFVMSEETDRKDAYCDTDKCVINL